MTSTSFATGSSPQPQFHVSDTKSVVESREAPSSPDMPSDKPPRSNSLSLPSGMEGNIRQWLFDLQKQKEAKEEHASLAPCRYNPSRHKLSENDQILDYQHPDGTTFKVAGQPCKENFSSDTCRIKNWEAGDASILLRKILDENGNPLWMLGKHTGIRGGGETSIESVDKNRLVPRVDVTDKFSVRHLPKNIELSYEADEEKHYLHAYVDKNNQLSLSSRAQGDRKTQGSGRDMFISLMKCLAQEQIKVDQIQAHWATNDDSVNTEKYLGNLNQGLSEKEAATDTWTGRMLGEYGFHPQTFRTSEDKTSIYVVFKK